MHQSPTGKLNRRQRGISQAARDSWCLDRSCGLITLDVLQVVERLPAPDEKIVATDLHVTFGGPAANAAATAAALGARVRLVTALGSGVVADLVRQGLRESGVELVDLLDGAPAMPTVSTVLVTRATGERAVVSVNATSTADLPWASIISPA